jgi:hypothetical protein
VLKAKSCKKEILCVVQDFCIATYVHQAALYTFNMPALNICLAVCVLCREADVNRY